MRPPLAVGAIAALVALCAWCAFAAASLAQAQTAAPEPGAASQAPLPFEATPIVEESTPVPRPTLHASVIRPSATGTAWTGDEIARLGAEVDGLLAGSSAIRGAHVGVLAVDARDGKTVY